MEASRKRTFLKHLEPARPLRRAIHAENAPLLDAAASTQEVLTEETAVDVEQLHNIFKLDQQKKGKISYSREFLHSLKSCPQAQTKPDFLAEDSLLSCIVTDPGELCLHEAITENVGEEELATLAMDRRPVHRSTTMKDWRPVHRVTPAMDWRDGHRATPAMDWRSVQRVPCPHP